MMQYKNMLTRMANMSQAINFPTEIYKDIYRPHKKYLKTCSLIKSFPK